MLALNVVYSRKLREGPQKTFGAFNSTVSIEKWRRRGRSLVKREIVNFLIYFVISSILSLLIFGSKLDNYFASDDWPAILRNTTFSWQQLPTWFTELRAGWYRPIHDMFIYFCWRLFELNPIGYRLVSIFVYALVSASVGLFLDVLTRDRRVSIVSVLLFTAFAAHSEPVLWFAGTNELLAGLFVLISVICYILYRETGNYGLIIISGIGAFLAFASKETSLFFPIILLIYDLLLFLDLEQKNRRWSFFIPYFWIAGLWIGFLLFRLPMGSSYSSTVSISLLGIVKNSIFYILIGILALPNNYVFLSSLPQWHASPGLPFTALFISTSAIVILGFAWLRTGILARKSYRKSLLLTSLWIIFALGPVIFIVTERAVFLASIGIVSVFSILLVGAWEATKEQNMWLKGAIAVAFFTYFGLNLYVLTYRSMWFEKSANLNQSVLGQLGQEVPSLETDASVVIVNLPDHTQHTFTFRNTFPSAAELLQYPIDVVPVLDMELEGKSRRQQQEDIIQVAQETDSDIVYWYQEGKLILMEQIGF